jgi:hypothetical protein
MAITLVSAPEKLGLAHNKIEWVFDSTNKGFAGMRYVVDIYHAGTSNKITELRIAPDIADGYCRIDVAPILRNLLSKTLDLTNTTWLAAAEQFVKYDIKVGEDVEVLWNYNELDTNFTLGLKRYVLVQDPQVSTHPFLAGDQVFVTNTAIAEVRGLKTVVSVPNAYSIEVSGASILYTPSANGGTVKYADGRKTITRNLYTNTNNLAYRGCIPNSEFINYNEDDYTNNTTDRGDFLSTARGLTILPTSKVFLNLYSNATQTTVRKVFFRNDNGDTFSKAINTTTNRDIMQIAVGGGNLGTLTTVSGTAPLIKPSTKYYDVWTANISDTRTSEEYRINVDNSCLINSVELFFMDKLGSFVSFPFTLKNDISGNVERKEFKQVGVGFTTFHTKERQSYTLRSNWVDDIMSVLYSEIISSPYVYLVIDGVYTFARVIDSSYQTLLQKNKRLNQYTINVEIAEDIPTNG